MKIDQKDLIILKLLQEDSNISNKEIAAATGLTNTPVFERIKKLNLMKLIKKKVFILNRKKLNLNLMVLVSIVIDKHSEECALNFMKTVKTMEEVVECFHTTGSFDFHLKVYVRDIDHYHEFNLKKLGAIKNIKHVQSHFVMKEVVNTTSLPLSIED
jgi:DNA-binding Lrp family transcriptional regulator